MVFLCTSNYKSCFCFQGNIAVNFFYPLGRFLGAVFPFIGGVINNDKICNYIMEYAKSKLMEDMQPELAIVHLNRAENYFSNLDDYSNNPFEQRTLDRKYKM